MFTTRNTRSRLTLVVVSLLLTGAANAQLTLIPPRPQAVISLPATIMGKPGTLIRVQAETEGDIQWYVDERLDSPDNSHIAGKLLLISSPTPGSYLVLAWTCHEGKPTPAARCTVIVEGVVPPTPVPPTPVPPTPVPPTPVPPTPVPDKLQSDLEAAYRADKASGSTAIDKRKLASIYLEGANTVRASQYLVTIDDVLKALKQVIEFGGVADKLFSIRRVAADYWNTVFPRTPGTPLTPELREKIATEFRKVGETLNRIQD